LQCLKEMSAFLILSQRALPFSLALKIFNG